MASVLEWAASTLSSRALTNGVGNYGFAGNDSLSPLGTPFAPILPLCLTNATSTECPWGNASVSNTNAYTTRPETGVTRYYNFTITKVTAAPDGVENTLLLINGEYPSPTIQCNWGDWLEITVFNNITNEGTGLHYHGMLQQETQWMDGVPGISQCPITPGASFTYRFKPDLYGTGWYHSHYEGQYSSGLAGPMVVFGPNHVDYDIDLGPVVVSDYYHEYYKVIEKGFLEQRVNVTASDNNLINGKNSYELDGAPLASFNFTSGKIIRLRLVNPSSFAVEKISIDGYNMTIFANDYVPIEPYETDVVTLAAGQRTDVLVNATGQPTDAVWLRAYKPPNCSPGKPGSYEAKAAIFYEDADRTQAPTTLPGPNAYDHYCGNDPLSLTVPVLPLTPGEPNVTEILPIELRPNGSSNLWYMANRTFRVDYNDPVLLDVQGGQLDFPWIRSVHNYGNNQSLRFVIQNTGEQPHPMHLHGHNFWVLQEGSCADNETVFPHGQPPFAHVLNPEQISELNGAVTSKRGIQVARADQYLEAREAKFWRGPNSVVTGANPNEAGSNSTLIGGYGSCWDGSIVNPDNPQRRDVQMLLPNSYIVLQWNQDNPGIWPLHCHIAWHLAAGYNWMVLERPDDIMTEMNIPDIMQQTCTDWDAWTSDHVVGQIDDGL
ncbi:Cupredoxin [Xylariomycetidae sp. FL2044]|nr:Cupredoxin [Xylariomycetidae sp. FL2044]